MKSFAGAGVGKIFRPPAKMLLGQPYLFTKI